MADNGAGGAMEHAGLQALKTLGDVEFPDAWLTTAKLRELKEIVYRESAYRSTHELMYLAGAFESAAQERRVMEGRS